MSIREELRDKIERISNLPTLPQIASRLLTLVNSPDTSAKEVAALVGQDISLSAKVLRLANSAYYGTPRAISTIQTAVVRLGFTVINTMVLSLTVFDMFTSNKKAVRFDRAAFWRHCIRCSVLAKILANKCRQSGVDPEEAFCAALLHDIGKVVMEQYLHEDFCSALEYAAQDKLSFYDAETKLLSYSHADVASWLIARWELPDQLHFPIINHHAPQKSEEATAIVSVCHCADFLSYDSDLAQKDAGIAPPLSEQAFSLIQQDTTPDDSLKELFAKEFEKAESFLDIIDGA